MSKDNKQDNGQDNRLVDLLAIFGLPKKLKDNRKKKKKRLDEITKGDHPKEE